jgi:Met-zincin
LMADVLAARGTIEPGGKVPEELIGQAIKEVVMHEVGHTLGLRHNFKSSTFISLKDCNNPQITRKKGMTGSVMDYSPANFAPKGQKQGDYFSDTIGPYDYWAIEYAYKPISGSEPEELAKIADKSSSSDLVYGTDEDTWMNPDPRINLFDLGDPLEFAQFRVQLMKDSLEKLQERVVANGEGWQRARDSFSRLLGHLGFAAHLASRYVGGEFTSRAHRGEPHAKLPFEPIPVAKQRQAIKLLKDEVLSDRAFKFSPELLKRLAPRHFHDEGFFFSSNYDLDVYERVLSIQRMVLSHFLDSDVLKAIQNSELHAGKDQEVLKLPEVFDALTDSVWSELPGAKSKSEPKSEDSAEGKKKLEISTVRRNLQREHVKKLSDLVLGPRDNSSSFFFFAFDNFFEPAPADARALARHHLKAIDKRIALVLAKDDSESDAYTRAHLEQVHAQIEKVFASSLKMNEP